MAPYGAPAWARSLTVHLSALLWRPQGAIRGYRTAVTEYLEAEMLVRLYVGVSETQAGGGIISIMEMAAWWADTRRDVTDCWPIRLERPWYGIRTFEAFRPVLMKWLGTVRGAFLPTDAGIDEARLLCKVKQ